MLLGVDMFLEIAVEKVDNIAARKMWGDFPAWMVLDVQMSDEQAMELLNQLADKFGSAVVEKVAAETRVMEELEESKLYAVRMSDRSEMTIPASSSCDAFVQAQDMTGVFASSARLA